ncbi:MULTISPECIES: ABC transporter substrate-binding protein [unclassified Aureimonas]|uniref:ABC transporter substrate-binding protein n=1 Tax=unclassified Aureimonas TaxID=2615206 RepID=UPI0006F92DDB|nr:MULTISPECIES: ABC transporter substrate-binding protein [unclassified Aureimonas]KQT52522.1 peptide ABC transporter substrate-binding protein [Aureimonas sp. Leaf427]KQT77577.1 peptide ABC transporter substrate-binding protein [Aureimonas sp. Leaf460]
MPFNLSRRAFLGASAAMTFAHVVPTWAEGRDTITLGLSTFPPNLKPWDQTGTAAGSIKLMIHRGLLTFTKEGELTGALAESWQREGDNSWIFKLRPAKFHDGSPVTSADVKWCLEQISAPASSAVYRGELQSIAAIETPDAQTVILRTKEPISTLPLWMASYNLAIVKEGSDLSDAIGAGPYRIASLERGTSMTLEAFPDYYKPEHPRTKTLKLVVYADENLRVAALDAGDVDIIEYVPWSAMEEIGKDAALTLDAVDGPFMGLFFNGSKAPFNDKRVRQAVAHAIRREEIVSAAFFGYATPLAHLPIAGNSPFYNADLSEGWAYDPDLSRRLLAEAGFADGLTCNILSTAQYRMLKDTAEVVQQQLAEVGIVAELQLPDWSTRVQLGTRGQYDIAVHGAAADTNDPDSLTAFVDGSLSPSISRSYKLDIPRITELLAAGRAEFDLEKRKAIYREMEAVALEDVPMVGLCLRKQGYAMKQSLSGFKNLPGQLTFSSAITFEDAVLGSS